MQNELEDQLYTFHEEKADESVYGIKHNEFQEVNQ